MRKRVIVGGIVKWVGEPYIPQHSRSKAFKMPTRHNRHENVEAILDFIAAWKKKEFTTGDIVEKVNLTRANASRWLFALELSQFSARKGNNSPKSYDTAAVKKFLRERSLI